MGAGRYCSQKEKAHSFLLSVRHSHGCVWEMSNCCGASAALTSGPSYWLAKFHNTRLLNEYSTLGEHEHNWPGVASSELVHGSGMVLGIGDRGRYLRRVVGRGGPGRRRQRPGPSPITTGAGSTVNGDRAVARRLHGSTKLAGEGRLWMMRCAPLISIVAQSVSIAVILPPEMRHSRPAPFRW